VAGDPDSEILIELNRIGGAIEVRAVSAGDGLEVVFTAPANAPRSDIEMLARAKLHYVRSRGSGSGGNGGQSGPTSDGRGGIVV
jgi:hypothetical protein